MFARKKVGLDESAGIRVLHDANGQDIYYIGIIDILQDYNVRKRAEGWLKGIQHGSRASECSAVEPSQYADRFIAFITNQVFCV